MESKSVGSDPDPIRRPTAANQPRPATAEKLLGLRQAKNKLYCTELHVFCQAHFLCHVPDK